eukprot:2840771-Amphidinium_carterae.2
MQAEPEGYTSDEPELSAEDGPCEDVADEQPCEQAISDAEEIVQSGLRGTPWTGDRIIAHKAQRDGTYKRLLVELDDGCTILQMRQALKRHLKLNISKVTLTMWKDGVDQPELADEEVASTSSQYHVRVRSVSAVPRGLGHGQTRAIGAPSGANPPQSPSAIPGRVERPGLVCATASDGSAPTNYQDALAARVTALEAGQVEILRILRSTQETMLQQIRSAQQVHDSIKPLPQRSDRTDKATARSSSSYGKSAWRQGGGKFHRVQQEAVSQSAASLVSTDLDPRPCDISGELIAHLLSHDRKCALACFQAKTRTQRLRALAAGLSRMGLSDQSRQVTAMAGGKEPRTATQHGGDDRASFRPSASVTQSPDTATTGPSQASDISSRLDVLELWAHSQDAANVMVDADDVGATASRSSSFAHIQEALVQLIDRRVQEAIADSAINMAQLEASHQELNRQPPTSRAPPGLDTTIGWNSSTAVELGPQDVAAGSAMGILHNPSLRQVCGRLFSLEKEMAGWASLLEAWKQDANGRLGSIVSRFDHVDQLLAMHTQAVRQSWAWLLAVVQTVQQHTPLPQAHETHAEVEQRGYDRTEQTSDFHAEMERCGYERAEHDSGRADDGLLSRTPQALPEDVDVRGLEEMDIAPAGEDVDPGAGAAGILDFLMEPVETAPFDGTSTPPQDDWGQ